MLTVSRTVTFCAAHRLWNPVLSPEENARIYGKCSREGGHGHNYTVTITVTGSVDKETGMIVNVTDLKKVMKKYIVDEFDHRDLNTDVPCLTGIITTMENITGVIAHRLEEPLNALGVTLTRLELKESDTNIVTLEKNG